MVQLYDNLEIERLEQLLNAFKNIRVLLVGDICLDVYWEADMTLSELSRETPHFPLPVIDERMSGGAGANVAANFAALGVKALDVVSIIGRDWRANELKRIFDRNGISPLHILGSSEWTTPAYCKPRRHGISEVVYEDPRIDFENRVPLSCEMQEVVFQEFIKAAPYADVIAVADQLKYGVITDAIIEELGCLARDGKKIVVDSRTRIGRYKNVIAKPNEVEAIKAVKPELDPRQCNKNECYDAALSLAESINGPVIMTIGDKGAIWADNGGIIEIPTAPVPPPIDIVGAGDAFMAAFCAALAAGASGPEAAAIANLAASVTVKKLGTTGSASPEEIIRRYEEVYE